MYDLLMHLGAFAIILYVAGDIFKISFILNIYLGKLVRL